MSYNEEPYLSRTDWVTLKEAARAVQRRPTQVRVQPSAEADRRPLRLPSIADVVDTRAAEGKGMNDGDNVGRWECSKCSRRGWIYWRDVRPAGRSTI